MLRFVLLIAAAASLLIEWGEWSLGAADWFRPWGWLGLFLWMLSQLIGGGVPARKGT